MSKERKENTEQKLDPAVRRNRKNMLATSEIYGGGKLVRDSYNRGHLTGRETLYHATKKDNVNSILEKGLLKEYASDPKNITHSILGGQLNESQMANKVYLGRKEDVARSTGFHHGPGNYKILQAKVPTWKLTEVDNPELLGVKNYKEFVKAKQSALEEILGKPRSQWTPLYEESFRKNFEGLNGRKMHYYLGRKGTAVFENDIAPKYIKGSKHFKRLSAKEFIDYVKHNKKRFATRGVGQTALGLGLAALGAKQLYDNTKQEKISMYIEEIYNRSIEK